MQLRKKAQATGRLARGPLKARLSKELIKNYRLWILLAPMIVYYLIFHYLPLYGIQIAFRNYRPVFGILGSDWVGLKHFATFFKSYYSTRLILNTFILNLLHLVIGFPIPILLAIMLNQLMSHRAKRLMQTIIYVPHFISTVVMVGILVLFLNPTNGLVNRAIMQFGGESVYFMLEPGWFRPLFVLSDIWQHAGWGSILFIAALMGIDQSLYEAAAIDGANKRQKIWHIDIPSLMPIATMMLILSCGALLASNTDKALLMQNSGNMSVSDIIGVYVYNQGLGKAQYSYTAAINLFINVINFVLIISVNWIARKLSDTSLF